MPLATLPRIVLGAVKGLLMSLVILSLNGANSHLIGDYPQDVSEFANALVVFSSFGFTFGLLCEATFGTILISFENRPIERLIRHIGMGGSAVILPALIFLLDSLTTSNIIFVLFGFIPTILFATYLLETTLPNLIVNHQLSNEASPSELEN